MITKRQKNVKENIFVKDNYSFPHKIELKKLKFASELSTNNSINTPIKTKRPVYCLDEILDSRCSLEQECGRNWYEESEENLIEPLHDMRLSMASYQFKVKPNKKN